MDYIIGQKPAPGAVPGAATATAGANMIVDGDQRTFMQDVIEASRSIPVLVDFWATWCGPCKHPDSDAGERWTKAAAGRVKLVKIDIDAEPGSLSASLRRSAYPCSPCPTVAAFWQGQVADVFQGAQPESEVKRFVEALLKATRRNDARPPTCWPRRRPQWNKATRSRPVSCSANCWATEPENGDAWGGLIRSLMAMDQ